MLLMIYEILLFLISVLTWIIIVQAVLSWLVAFNVVNTSNDLVRQLLYALERITEPLYRPIRRILPDFGALDLSPLVVLLILQILSGIVLPRLMQAIVSAG